jgi:hypothetical protein
MHYSNDKRARLQVIYCRNQDRGLADRMNLYKNIFMINIDSILIYIIKIVVCVSYFINDYIY